MPPKPSVFVLMPYHTSFDDIYLLGIKQTCEDAGADCTRADEQIHQEKILDRVYNQIAKADVIVAEMTGCNANVFYEVGYAHALNKHVILLTQEAKDIPFDLTQYQHIIYGNKITHQLKPELSKKLRWCLDNPKKPTRFITSETGFLLINKKSNKCIDVPWEVELDVVHQWEQHRDVNQQWTLRQHNDGTIVIISNYTNRCLGIVDCSTKEGSLVSQQTYTASEHQHWNFEERDDHSFKISAKHSGQCLDLQWGDTKNGVVTIQWPWHGGDNQRWFLRPAFL